MLRRPIKIQHGGRITSIFKTNFDCFAGGLSAKLHAGDYIYLWNNKWIGEAPFKTMFLNLFRLAEKPMGKICKMGGRNDSGWNWNLHIEADKMLEDPIATEEAFSLIEFLINIRLIFKVKYKLLW